MLDVDLSPLPVSKHAEGSERGYMGRCRSKTGRKLVRVRAAATGEIVWETVIAGGSVESLPVLQEAIKASRAPARLGGRRRRGARQANADRDPPGQRLGKRGDDHLAPLPGLSSDRQIQIKWTGAQTGAGDHPMVYDFESWCASVAPVPEPVEDVASPRPICGTHPVQRVRQRLLPCRCFHKPH